MANNPYQPGNADPSGFPPWPPYPPCPPIPRGPVGPPGPPGPRGLPGSMNTTATSFAYAQLAHLLEQFISLYPASTLYVFLSGFNFWYVAGTPYQLYKSSEGTFGGLMIENDGGYAAIPLTAITALQFETGTMVYNPAITYLPKPNFPPGYDTNILTAVYDYVNTITGDMTIYTGCRVYSTGPLYLNKYGMIIQADAAGNDPAFIPVMNITGIVPDTAAKKKAASEDAPPTLIQGSLEA